MKNLITLICGLILSLHLISSINKFEPKGEVRSNQNSGQINVRRNPKISIKSGNKYDFRDKSKLQSDKPIIKPSNVIQELELRKAQNPHISNEEMANIGNELAKAQGYKFVFENCKLAEQDKGIYDSADYDKFKPFDYQMTDLKGKQSIFQFMNNDFGHPCFCIIDVPTLKVNKQTMTIIANGKAINLNRPKEFYLEEFVLFDKNLQKEIRKWFTPIDATPIGISGDGTKVYFEETKDLAIEMHEDGTIQFVAINDKRIIKGKELKGYPTYGEISYRIFKSKNREYIVKFSYPCT